MRRDTNGVLIVEPGHELQKPDGGIIGGVSYLRLPDATLAEIEAAGLRAPSGGLLAVHDRVEITAGSGGEVEYGRAIVVAVERGVARLVVVERLRHADLLARAAAPASLEAAA